jgi:hypothetical protein
MFIYVDLVTHSFIFPYVNTSTYGYIFLNVSTSTYGCMLLLLMLKLSASFINVDNFIYLSEQLKAF